MDTRKIAAAPEQPDHSETVKRLRRLQQEFKVPYGFRGPMHEALGEAADALESAAAQDDASTPMIGADRLNAQSNSAPAADPVRDGSSIDYIDEHGQEWARAERYRDLARELAAAQAKLAALRDMPEFILPEFMPNFVDMDKAYRELKQAYLALRERVTEATK